MSFTMYYDVIEKYREKIDIIVSTDSKLETDWTFIEKLKVLGSTLYQTTHYEYEGLANKLLFENKYKIIMPTQYDSYQHIYGYDYFSKKTLYSQLNSMSLLTPKIYNDSELIFPVIAKPLNGSGSHGVRKFNDKESLDMFINEKPRDYIDFGKGYQIEEYIDGLVVSVSLCKIKNKSRFLALYDTESDDPIYYLNSKRSYPSKFTELFKNNVLDKLLAFADKHLSDNWFMMLDAIVKDNQFYFIDAGYRLQNTHMSKHFFRKFLLDYTEYRMGNLDDVPEFSHTKIIQYYFKDMYDGEIPKFSYIKEFVKPKKISENIWNEKLLNDRGYVIIESDDPERDSKNLEQFMKRDNHV
jgi:hypothetical protein